MSQKLLFIFNPHAGKGQIKNHLVDIVDMMVKAGFDVTIYTTQAQADSGEYILPESSERALTDADVQGMSYDDLQMAINEIYARHGRIFGTESIQQYFEGKSWYQGTTDADHFSDSVFSSVENQNIQFLLKKMGLE